MILKGLFSSKSFYDSMISTSVVVIKAHSAKCLMNSEVFFSVFEGLTSDHLFKVCKNKKNPKTSFYIKIPTSYLLLF